MKTFIGNGKGSTKAAVEEAVKGLSSPSMILFMTPYTGVEEAAKLLWEKFPGVPSIGTIGTKLANGTVGDDNIVVLGLFQDAKVSCGVIPNLSDCPLAYIKEVEQKINEVSPGKEDTVCVEYCTGYEERLVTTLHSCFGKKGIGLMGGTTFGVPEGKEALVAYNGKVYPDSCVYALIKNTTGKAKVFKENIYKKKNDISHIATKVNVENRALIELDGRPATAVYSQEVGVPTDKIVDNVIVNPMGRAVGDQVFISAMKALNGKGEIENFKRINKNDCIYFLELADYKEIEEKTRSDIRSQMKKISLVISVDCAHRYALYSGDGYLSRYATDMAGLGPQVGIVGGGEQFNNQHVNQTMVCAVFE